MTSDAGPEPAAAGAEPSSSSSIASTGHPPASSGAHAPADGRAGADPGRPGHQVVLGLFVVLAACVIIVFTIFALAVRPEDRHWLPELTARYLYMPVVATGLLVAIDAHRLGHPRWWMLLLAAPIPVVNVALAAMWILAWRHRDRPPGTTADSL